MRGPMYVRLRPCMTNVHALAAFHPAVYNERCPLPSRKTTRSLPPVFHPAVHNQRYPLPPAKTMPMPEPKYPDTNTEHDQEERPVAPGREQREMGGQVNISRLAWMPLLCAATAGDIVRSAVANVSIIPSISRWLCFTVPVVLYLVVFTAGSFLFASLVFSGQPGMPPNFQKRSLNTMLPQCGDKSDVESARRSRQALTRSGEIFKPFLPTESRQEETQPFDRRPRKAGTQGPAATVTVVAVYSGLKFRVETVPNASKSPKITKTFQIAPS